MPLGSATAAVDMHYAEAAEGVSRALLLVLVSIIEVTVETFYGERS